MAARQIFLSDRQLGERYGVDRLTIWRWHRTDPTFPRAIRLSSNCTRWSLEEVEQWQEERRT